MKDPDRRASPFVNDASKHLATSSSFRSTLASFFVQEAVRVMNRPQHRMVDSGCRLPLSLGITRAGVIIERSSVTMATVTFRLLQMSVRQRRMAFGEPFRLSKRIRAQPVTICCHIGPLRPDSRLILAFSEHLKQMPITPASMVFSLFLLRCFSG